MSKKSLSSSQVFPILVRALIAKPLDLWDTEAENITSLIIKDPLEAYT